MKKENKVTIGLAIFAVLLGIFIMKDFDKYVCYTQVVAIEGEEVYVAIGDDVFSFYGTGYEVRDELKMVMSDNGTEEDNRDDRVISTEVIK